jgi:hypothetical protein
VRLVELGLGYDLSASMFKHCFISSAVGPLYLGFTLNNVSLSTTTATAFDPMPVKEKIRESPGRCRDPPRIVGLCNILAFPLFIGTATTTSFSDLFRI